MKTPTKELTPARKELAQWSAIIGTTIPAYLIFFMDWTPALTVSALGLGTAWVALRPVSDQAIVEWLTDSVSPAVTRRFLKWSAMICAGSVAAIQLVTRIS